VQWPLISLTRSYESKAVFAVNHNASLFSLSEDEAHSQEIKTVEKEQPQTSYSSRICKIHAKTNFVSPICHCIKLDYEQKMFQNDKKHARHITKLDYEQKMFQSDKKHARHITKYHDHTQSYSDGLKMCFLVLLTENLEFLTHASLILLRGAETLTFLYTVSILQPSPHINRQGSGTLFVQFVSFVDGEKVYVA
jgi:hypothetical protein